jgi:PAS domain S-box-containing protein
MSSEENDLTLGDLRRQAEMVLRSRKRGLEAPSIQELKDLVHELEVHQVELELQNEELRQTQDALELARDEYAELYDRAPVGYITVNGDGTIARANATAAALLAVEPEALVGLPFYHFVARPDQDAYHFFLVRLTRGQGRETIELGIVRDDGRLFRARIEASLDVREPGGDIEKGQRWWAAVSDVSAEHRAREALRLSEAREAQHQNEARQAERFRTLAELGDALAATLDLEEVAALALARIAALAGAPEAFLLPYANGLGGRAGRVLTLDEGWIDLSASDRYFHWQQPLEALRRRRRRLRKVPRPVQRLDTPWSHKVLVVPLDEDKPVADLVLAGRAFGDDDEALAVAAAGRASQAVRNARLYCEVRDLLRQREEMQAQLVQSEKLASLGRLTMSLSHEINNPIQSILGCLELSLEELARGSSSESLERYLSMASDEVRRVARLVGRMREFYQPSRMALEVVDVAQALQVVLDLTANELRERRVAVQWTASPEVPPVPMRIDQLQQVFLNLILNAAEAMAGGGTLTLSTGYGELRHSRNQPEPGVYVDIQDTGGGLPTEVRKRLFEPFVSTKKGGSGLGLYICHGIIQAHGGEIVVHSDEGEGTRVTVWLPLEPQQDIEHGEV